jgi:hypothetical protein
MIGRWFAGLSALALLLLSSTSLRAADTKPDRCGFQIEAGRIQTVSAGVPLLLIPAPLSVANTRRLSSRRTQLLAGEHACTERYPGTVRYLRTILGRLLERSGLAAFATDLPGMELVLDCSHPIPLPIALSTTGKVMLAARALPALATSEDAIAAVLGHELAHLTLRHPEQLMAAMSAPIPLARSAARSLQLSHERQADVAGLKLAASAGYDPLAAIEHLRRVEQLAAELTRAGKLPPERIDSVHDGVEPRVQLLDGQIKACGYHRPSARTPVAPAVKRELERLP